VADAIAIRVGEPARNRQQFGRRSGSASALSGISASAGWSRRRAMRRAQLVRRSRPNRSSRRRGAARTEARGERVPTGPSAQIGEQRYRLAAAGELDEQARETILDVESRGARSSALR
jgi:hypothetical protein